MIDYGIIYRALSRRYGWTPSQIAAMTSSQQTMYLEGDDGDSDLVHFDSVAEARAYQQSKAGK